MNESLIKIKNKIKSFVSFKNVNPHVYWTNLLRVFFISTLILVSFSFYLLYEIKNQQIFQIIPKTTSASALINDKLFIKITESFNFKLNNEKKIKEGTILYKDPSQN
jgi:hypothetical protein